MNEEQQPANTADSPDPDPDPWLDARPQDLPGTLLPLPQLTPASAARWISNYTRHVPGARYDLLAWRHAAAARFAGRVLNGNLPAQEEFQDPVLRSVMEQEYRQAVPADLDRILDCLDDAEQLKPRALELPDSVTGCTVQRSGETLRVTPHPAPGQQDASAVIWRFPLRAPPARMLQSQLAARDAPELLCRRLRQGVPDTHWLPLPVLLAHGTFQPMQALAGVLTRDFRRGDYHAFVSHRWLAREHPDPEGRQAAQLCWQLFAAVCEAIHMARVRGLERPRTFSRSLGCYLGPHGSALAESVLVNLVRPAVVNDELGLWWDEIAAVEDAWRDGGRSAARAPDALAALRAILRDMPLCSRLMDRIHLWHDYSCMPQAPRTPAEQAVFEAGLRQLNAIQASVMTLVLLDDITIYCRRAWCAVETLLADTGLGALHIMAAEERHSFGAGRRDHTPASALEDLAFIAWRAVLDTELFGRQSPAQCMQRLGLATTDPADLMPLYFRLSRLPAPRRVIVSDADRVTGVFPLPRVDDGRSVLIPRSQGRHALGALTGRAPVGSLRGPAEIFRASLDWPIEGVRDAVSLPASYRFPANGQSPGAASGSDPGAVAPGAEPARPGAHLAIFASCEGEALLLASWLARVRGELEALLGVRVESQNWLACDGAPVGHFPHGGLRAEGFAAGVWILAGARNQIERSRSVALLADTLERARKTTLLAFVDSGGDDGDHGGDGDGGGDGGGGGGGGDNVFLLSPQAGKDYPAAVIAPEDWLEEPAGGFPFHPAGLLDHALTAAWLSDPDAQHTVPTGRQDVARSPADTLGLATALMQPQTLDASVRLAASVLELPLALQGGEHVACQRMACHLLARGFLLLGDFDAARHWAMRLQALPGSATHPEVLAAVKSVLDEITRLDPDGAFAGSRAAVVSAQRLSDGLHHAASNALLMAHLDRIPRSCGAELVTKVLGLMGLNHHALGNREASRRCTQLAVESAAGGDPEAFEVYLQNLRSIEDQGPAEAADQPAGPDRRASASATSPQKR